MDIKVRRGQEPKKGGFMSGSNTKLTLEVTVVLSDEEKALIEKYYNPSFEGKLDYVKYYEGTGEGYEELKVDRNDGSLTDFHLDAHIDNGHGQLGNMQEFENAVIRALSSEIEGLKALAGWKGESTIEA